MKFTVSALLGFAALAAATDCVTKYDACRDAGDTNSADCAAENAQCKNTCAVALDTCRSSGDPANEAPCQDQYNKCLVNVDFVPTHLDCFSEYDGCRDTNDTLNNTQTCATTNAQCKNACGNIYDTCLTSGDESLAAPCMSIYNNCLVDLEKAAAPKSLDCVSKYENCRDPVDGNPNECAAHNAQCKNACANIYDTCLTSGDENNEAACLQVYSTCLVSFDSDITNNYPDCVSKYMACDEEDNTCSSYNAQCKNSCSNMYDTCLSSGDESVKKPCLTQYDRCLVAFPKASATASSAPATSTPASCVEQVKSCKDEDNVCDANNAQCKNTCVTAYDTCRTSGNPDFEAPCLANYESCLGEKYDGSSTPTSVAVPVRVAATGASSGMPQGYPAATGAPFGNATVPEPTVFVTEVTTAYTTYCPAATVVTLGSDKYTVTEATTLVVSQTKTETVTSTPAVAHPAEPTVYTTEVATMYTTYCPASTVVSVGTDKYTVTEATTLVVPQTQTLTLTTVPAVETKTFVASQASAAASSASAAVSSVEQVVSSKIVEVVQSVSKVIETMTYTDKIVPTWVPKPLFPGNVTAPKAPGNGAAAPSGAAASSGFNAGQKPSSTYGNPAAYTGAASKAGAAGLAGIAAVVAFAL